MWVLPVSVGSAVCPEPSSVSSSSSSMNDTSVGGAWTGALKVESKTGKGCLNKTLKWKMHKGKNLKEPKVWTNSCKKIFDLQRGVKTEDLRCLRIDFIAFCWIYSQIRIQIKHFHRRFLQSDGRLKEFSTSLWSASDKLWLWSAADEAAWPQWPPSLLKRFEPAAQAAGKSSSHESFPENPESDWSDHRRSSVYMKGISWRASVFLWRDAECPRIGSLQGSHTIH